jgi:hypothetical protein
MEANWALQDGSAVVLSNREAFEEVLVVLAEYARELTDGVGDLTMETELTRITEARSTLAGELAPGDYVNLKVSIGKVLDQESLLHFFEPFGSTTQEGENRARILQWCMGSCAVAAVGSLSTLRTKAPR